VVHRCQKFILDALVHASAVCTDSRCPVYTGALLQMCENRCGTGGLGWEPAAAPRRVAEETDGKWETKITNVTLLLGFPQQTRAQRIVGAISEHALRAASSFI